jgi:hypothetical protein
LADEKYLPVPSQHDVKDSMKYTPSWNIRKSTLGTHQISEACLH